MPTHECTGDDCKHESHAAPVADAAPAEGDAVVAPAEGDAAPAMECKACAGEEGAEHTCGK